MSRKPGEEAQDRPLVTFALFAYNQEKFIREAVEGAFAQTYQPLEIILSDDCSTDRTFNIMKEMAEAYEGPHRVRVRQTGQNRGTFNHVLETAGMARGQLIVLAAGDDMSLPERTAILVGKWLETGAGGLCSRYNIIDRDGTLLQENVEPRGGREIARWFAARPGFRFVHGGTSAYDRVLLSVLGPAREKVFSEDAVLSVILALRGMPVAHIGKALVNYRSHPASWSNNHDRRRDYASVLEFERKMAHMAGSYIALCDHVEGLIGSQTDARDSHDILAGIADTRHFARIRRDMYGGPRTRARALAACRNRREFRYALPRIFGPRPLAMAKHVLWRLKSLRSGWKAR